MAPAQVGRNMPEGLRAFANLMHMLVEAAAGCGVPVKKVPAWDAMGVTLDGKKYWVGVSFSEPEHLGFLTCDRIDPDAASRLGVGELAEADWVPGRHRWAHWVNLDEEAVHFFARSKVRQMEWIEKHLRDWLAKARSVAAPGDAAQGEQA